MKHIGTSLLLEIREKARENKDWSLSDQIRDILDERLDFVFDTKEGQLLHSYSESFFKNMPKIACIYNLNFTNKRQFVEWKLKDDIRINALVDSWIYSNQSK